MSTVTRRPLTGWGRTNPTVGTLHEACSVEDLVAAITGATDRGVIARGLGRSYGDAAQNAGGSMVRLEGRAGDAALDPSSATVTAGGGVSLDDLMRVIVPRGFFVPVTPGTRFVTVGGAIASDIHGKNHHVDGSFGNHVLGLRLLLADGSVASIGPDRDPELFWATVGGMGLTGVILEATFRVLPIETSRMSVDTSRVPDLEALYDAMSSGDDEYRYSVAWIDLLAKGRSLGRSVLTRAEHATVAQLGVEDRSAPLAYGPRQLLSVPPLVPPSGVLNHFTVAAFNELWFRKAPRRREGEIQTIGSYFHPLDIVGSWARLYGSRGMVQYQFVVPFGQEGAMRAVIERISASGAASFLAVLKRFGQGNPGHLSFPEPGWTLALDVPARSHGIGELLHQLDTVVLDAGGKFYFAKDAHTTPEAIRRCYPRLDEWRRVRDAVDPDGRWQSDLSRRLGLTGRQEGM